MRMRRRYQMSRRTIPRRPSGNQIFTVAETPRSTSIPSNVVPAHDECIGRATPKLNRGAIGARAREGDQRSARLAAATRVEQRICERLLELRAVRGGRSGERERATIEVDRAVERERGARALGGFAEESRCARCVTSPLPVQREPLDVPLRGRIERPGDALVPAAACLRVQVRDDGLANTVVIRLDAPGDARPGYLHEVRGAERGHRLGELAPRDSGRRDDEIEGDRRARDCHRFDDAALALAEEQHATPQCVVEANIRARLVALRSYPDELLQEERMPAGLLRNRRERGPCELPRAGKAGRECRDFLGRQTAESDSTHDPWQRRRFRVRCSFGRGGVLCQPPRAKKQKRRRRRGDQTAEKRERVAVGPLDVVDRDDEGLLLRDAGDKLAERGEDPRAQLLSVALGARCRRLSERGEEPDAAEDRE